MNVASQASSGEKSGRQYYDEFLGNLLAGALARKGTIEQRGVNVVTTAGTLVTAVFAIVSFVLAHTGSGTLNPHHIIRGWIDVAAFLFVVAGILGLLVNIPVPYGDPDPKELDNLMLPEERPIEQSVGFEPPGSDNERELIAIAFEQLGSDSTDDEIRQFLHRAQVEVTTSEINYVRSGKTGLFVQLPSPFLANSADTAAYRIAATRVDLLRKARRWNSVKAQLLFWAVVAEVVAITFLAWGIHRLLV
jgi:hypothetical protein